jgi:dihydrofolate reductase
MPREIVLIAAVAANGVIGRNNALPWRLKGDMQFFRRTTTGHTVVMGRKTWESLSRPLPGRRNVVVSRNPDFRAEGAELASSLEAALALAGEGPIFVIGGAMLYRQALPYAGRLLLTEVAAEVEGDARFPDFDHTAFIETARVSHLADADNDHPYSFVEYRRR